jgi:hypothetical protein
MKNPFEKVDNRATIGVVLLGGLALGAVAYLYLTDKGAGKRSKFKRALKEKGKELASSAISKKTGLSKKLVKKVADHVV